MASLADKAILSSAGNRPLMLEKDMYDSWKSRMELYMLNRPHGRMILESVEQCPLIWPSVEVEGVTRLKKYSELSAAEAIQADCDVKATNIIMQGLPPEVYALVSTYKVAKELWESIQMLMQGTSLTKQERECKLKRGVAVTVHDSKGGFYFWLLFTAKGLVVRGGQQQQGRVCCRFINQGVFVSGLLIKGCLFGVAAAEKKRGCFTVHGSPHNGVFV
nr:hypothetical protein [Tanacetum cinerariifolium]